MFRPTDKSQVANCVIERVAILVMQEHTQRNRPMVIPPHHHSLLHPHVRLGDLDKKAHLSLPPFARAQSDSTDEQLVVWNSTRTKLSGGRKAQTAVSSVPRRRSLLELSLTGWHAPECSSRAYWTSSAGSGAIA